MARSPQSNTDKKLVQSDELPTGWLVNEETGEVQDPETKRMISLEEAKRVIVDREEEAKRAAASTAAQGQKPEEKQLPDATVANALAASRMPAQTAAMAAQNQETVTMIFPQRMMLTLDDHSRIEFKAGPQEVPRSLVDHPYLRQAGVKPYNKEE